MRKYSVCLVVLVALLFTGCEKEILVPQTGGIIGFVTLYDEEGIVLADKSGVKVALNEQLNVTTDINGRFEFVDAPAGNYVVVFTKDGFGTYKKYNFSFAGGSRYGVIEQVAIPALPSYGVSDIEVSTGSTYVRVRANIDEVQRYRFVYYFSRKPNVSSEDYLFCVNYTLCCGQVNSIDHSLFLTHQQFAAGEKLYLRVGTANYFSSPYDYFSPIINNYVNPSTVQWGEAFEVTMP